MLRLFIKTVKEMGWNKNGKDVRKAPQETSNKIFGIMKPSKSPHLRIRKETEHVGNIYLHAQTGNILRELECQKSQALAATQFRLHV